MTHSGSKTETPALQANDVSFVYRTARRETVAINHVDLAVGAGEFVSVMGPSGCGKSTLLYILGTLLRPTTGDLLIDGRSVLTSSDDELSELRGRRIGFVFQSFNLIPVLTVAENVAMPASLAGEPSARYQPRVDELLDAVGLTAQRDQRPNQLSGGEQQRAAIARALVMQPAVLLADEPTGNLDSESGLAVLQLFAGFHQAGQTIVLVTHDVKVASLSERLVTLHDGTVVREESLIPQPAPRRRQSRIVH